MTHEFQSILYRTSREMCDAIAKEWLSGGGANSRDDMVDALEKMTDEELADECIEGWGLSAPNDGDDPNGPSWMDARDATYDDLITAFQVLRDNF